jgi:hypothetical protein
MTNRPALWTLAILGVLLSSLPALGQVSLVDNVTTVTLANGIVTATIPKSNGQITSMKLVGRLADASNRHRPKRAFLNRAIYCLAFMPPGRLGSASLRSASTVQRGNRSFNGSSAVRREDPPSRRVRCRGRDQNN